VHCIHKKINSFFSARLQVVQQQSEEGKDVASHGLYSFPPLTLGRVGGGGGGGGLAGLSVAPVGLISRQGIPSPPDRLHECFGLFFVLWMFVKSGLVAVSLCMP